MQQTLQPLRTLASGTFKEIRYILTDIDDTLTLAAGGCGLSGYSGYRQTGRLV
jgi:hypothetical protein